VAKNRTSLITPLQLSEQEVLEMVEFLKALDGEPINATIPKLPPMTKAEKEKAKAEKKKA
ncbi:MAG: hypothetical protein OEZ27_07745, partial [Nitrospinota bacterium]|nr:hypothetical protein [Nitrospinota bacterium]